MERSLGRILPRAISRLYEEPKKLVAAGLASSRHEATGRRRSTVYSITPKGREALAGWLAEPGTGPVFECEALVKIAYTDQGARDGLLANLAALIEDIADVTAVFCRIVSAASSPLGRDAVIRPPAR
jgi:PadR family transcriptional regulator, regulatory protein AphA